MHSITSQEPEKGLGLYIVKHHRNCNCCESV